MAADHMYELDADLLALATELEGHPDNVGAALEGGIVICDGRGVHRFEPPLGLEAVLVVPAAPVDTARARAALPASVPLADASFNLAAEAKLVLGLARGDFELIGDGPRRPAPPALPRARCSPQSAALLDEVARLGALGATISGAGPTVMVWCRFEQTGGVVEALTRRTPGWATVLRAPLESQGADVRSL